MSSQRRTRIPSPAAAGDLRRVVGQTPQPARLLPWLRRPGTNR